MKLLGVRPYPELNESLSGYLLRLATWNGFTSIKELLHTIGIQKPKASLWGVWKQEEQDVVFATLSIVLNRTAGIIAAPFFVQCQSWMFSEHYQLQELRVDFPRVCPECMKQEKVIDWRWNIATVARCSEHEILLVDHCPECKESFDWNYHLFTGCEHCSFEWKKFKTEVVTSATPLEQRLYPKSHGYMIAARDELNSLIQAIVLMARPYDARIEKLQRVPFSPNHSQLLLKAYALLQDPSVQLDWQKQNHQKNGLFAAAIIKPKLKLLNIPPMLETTSIHHEFDERPEYVSRARNKLRVNGQNESLLYHVFHDELAALFSIRKEDLVDLIQQKVLASLNSTPFLRDKIFDYRALVHLTDENLLNESPTGWIKVDRKSAYLRQYLCQYGDLLTAIMTKTVLGGFTDKVDISSVVVEPESFSSWLRQQVQLICADTVSPTDAAKALQCSRDELDELVKQGKFKWASWQRGATLIDGPSLCQYILQMRLI